MTRSLLVLLMLGIFSGCQSGSDTDHDVAYRQAQAVVYDPYEYSPRYELALFSLTQEQHYIDGHPSSAETRLHITNTSGLIATFNFVVSGPGWRFESAVVQLPPNATVSFGVIATHFRTLDNFWVTVPDVIYTLASNT